MKYKVTFENGQVSVYDTVTQFDEFKTLFTTAIAFEILDGDSTPETAEVKVPARKVVKKNG